MLILPIVISAVLVFFLLASCFFFVCKGKCADKGEDSEEEVTTHQSPRSSKRHSDVKMGSAIREQERSAEIWDPV